MFLCVEQIVLRLTETLLPLTLLFFPLNILFIGNLFYYLNFAFTINFYNVGTIIISFFFSDRGPHVAEASFKIAV